jgi:ABC-2 type transport system ATP-binding protein
MTSDVLISTKDLKKTYKKLFKKGFPALRGISLEVGRGSVFGLLGPNGAGKTTMIKVLLGLIPKYEGTAQIFGQAAGSKDGRRRIGFLPEAHRLPGYLTAYQTLMMFGMYSGRDSKWLKKRIPAWLERIDMLHAQHKKLREFSKGMQQRVGLIQAIIHEPELIFLDEPTDGVDPVGRKVVREIIDELRGTGTTIFVNSHLLQEVEKMCDEVVIMDKGKIIQEGSMESLTNREGRVNFDLAPHDANISLILKGIGTGLTITQNGFDVSLSNAERDQTIDLIRAAGLSIRTINESKVSLEDVFIDLIEKKQS